MSDEIPMLNEPLVTEGGFLNPACMAELEATVEGIGRAHERLSGRSEWSEKKDKWTFAKGIVGAFAMWACRQSPYGTPDGLENVCKYLHAALKTAVPWDANDMAELSLCEINRLLYDILYEQGVKEFDAWNERKNGRDGMGICSAFDSPIHDDDFIDLDALLRNVCNTISRERQQDER